MLRYLFAAIGLSVVLSGSSARAAETGVYNPRDFGARGDGQTKDTQAVQAAIDAAGSAGGGTVQLTAGRYLCGTLHLHSHLTIQVESGALVLESTDLSDFGQREVVANKQTDGKTVDFHCALFAGEDIEDIAIEGHGVIDGNRTTRSKASFGPKPIALKKCRQVTIRDLTINNSPSYAVSMLGCEHVNIDGVTIYNSYEDGIDPDSCRYVRIANCDIDARDDAIVLKSSCVLDPPQPTEYVTITNCVLATDCNYFKMGTESSGAFRHIAFSNCAMVPRLASLKTDENLAGIAIETVDGADLDGVVISNVTMVDVWSPIFLRLGARGRNQPVPKPGVLRNVSISNIVATGSRQSCTITGIPGHPIEGVTLSDIRISTPALGKPFDGIAVPDKPGGYPDPDMYSELPCTGFFLRHVAGITLRNIQIERTKADRRAILVSDDVSDLDLDGFQMSGAPVVGPVLWLNNTRSAAVRNVRAAGVPAANLVRMTGASHDVHVQAP